MINAATQNSQIVQLEKKIERLEANRKVLIQIIEDFDKYHKTGIWMNELSLLSELSANKK